MSGPLQNPFMFNSAADANFYEYQIANSCRFDRASSAYLNRTIQSGGDLDKWTLSFWMKLTASAGFGSNQYHVYTSEDNTSGAYDAIQFDVNSSSQIYYSITNKYFTGNHSIRDPSAWYHVVIVFDSANGTAAHRKRVWFNNVEDTGSDVQTYPQNVDSQINKNTVHNIGARQDENAAYFFDGYLADFIFVDAQAYAPTYFGEEKNGVWIPKDYKTDTGEYGTTGYHLDFASSGDLGNDVSGNNNDWTSNNLVATDQMKDTPTFDGTSQGGNFPTIGGLEKNTGGFTFSEGNLKYAVSTNQRGFIFSQGVPESGKYYWEVRVTQYGGSEDQVHIGVCQPDKMRGNLTASRGGAQTSGGGGYTFDQYNGAAWLDGSKQSDDSIGNLRTTPQTFGFAIDRDNDTFKWTYDGSTYSSTYTIPSSGVLAPYIGSGGGSNTASGVFNFGADSTFAGLISAGGNADGNGYGDFSLAVPSGYLAMCAANLPTPAADPADDDGPGKYFNTVTYTGTGSSEGITGVGFQPDVVLIKNRGESDDWNHQNDVLGVAKTQAWNTDAAVADETDCIDSFDSDGFTVDSDHKVNASTETYVAYCWKESADAGFDIYTYSGTGSAVTVSHSLGVVPDLILNFLNTGSAWDSTSYWNTSSMGTGKGLFMPLTNAAQSTTYVDSTSTTNFVTTNMSASGRTYFGYAIANKEGLVKVGEYEGNGNADGPFVYTGFRPAFILIKSIDGARHWGIHDNKRSPYNVSINQLDPDAAYAAFDSTGRARDFLSNGFKLRTNDADVNGSGETYAYMAWAENPFKYTTAK